jgi:hypothetical protein
MSPRNGTLQPDPQKQLSVVVAQLRIMGHSSQTVTDDKLMICKDDHFNFRACIGEKHMQTYLVYPSIRLFKELTLL